jgi:hypothetical protein
MILLAFAAIGGGLATALIMAPFGVASAVLTAPLGGSLCAALAAVYVARQSGHERQGGTDLDEQTDAMVASLRGVAAQAKQATEEEAKPSDRDHDGFVTGAARRTG